MFNNTEYMREWRKKNPHKAHESYLRNKKKISEKKKIYRIKNKEKLKIYEKQYRKENPEKIKEGKRKAYQKNKTLYRGFYEKWKKENPEQYKDICKKYQKEYRGNPLNLEKIRLRKYCWEYLRDKIIEKRKCCEKCGAKKNLDIHHKNYLEKNKLSNLQLLCRTCHKKLHQEQGKEDLK